MNRARFPLLEVALVALIVVAMGFLIATSYRARQAALSSVDTYSSYDKSAGGYAAWYELLRREGLRVGRFERRPAYLDESIDTLVAAPSTIELEVRAQRSGNTIGQLADVDYQSLHDWVMRGGHLLWVTDGEFDARFLHMPDVADVGPRRDEAIALVPVPSTAGVGRVDGTSRLRLPSKTSLAAAPLVADHAGAVVAHYAIGKGTVTVVTDQTLFTNARLSRADNARLAYDLATAGTGPHGTVAFDEWLHGYNGGDTWWTILPVPIRAALAVVVLAVVLLAVGTALRFGPVAQPRRDEERTSAEYVTSMAALLARGRAGSKALRDLVAACARDVATALGMPESTSIRALHARLQLGGPDTATDASDLLELDRLQSYERPSNAELVRGAQLCARLRKEYTRYGRLGFSGRAAPARRSA